MPKNDLWVGTSEDFRYFTRPHHVLSESPCHFVQMDEEIEKAGKVLFSFDHVPKGTYAVFAYQDINNSGKVGIFRKMGACLIRNSSQRYTGDTLEALSSGCSGIREPLRIQTAVRAGEMNVFFARSYRDCKALL